MILKEGDIHFVLRGDNVVLKSPEDKLVASGKNIISKRGIISSDKIVTKGFIGKDKDFITKVKAEALSSIPKVLEELGYQLERE